jgi:hypothetical protein
VKASLVSLVVALLVAFSSASAQAQTETPDALFARGAAAVQAGSINEAVEAFEALADQGFAHPDASFDRALAYIGRVRASAEHPGDLGRAAAALEETLLIRPDDREAEAALDVVRAEVARRRARGGWSADVESKPTIDRALVGLASERTRSVLAIVASFILTAGLLLRILGSKEQTGSAHLAGAIAVPIGAVGLLVFSLLSVGARHLRHTTLDGVIVATEARLVTEKGIADPGAPIPEAARVEIGERRGALVHVRWGHVEGWTQAAAVRLLARPQ